MYQNVLLSQFRLTAAAVALLFAFGAGSAVAQDAVKCQRTIAKESAKYEATRMKALQKCEDGILKGKVTSCPDSKATDKINKAAGKLADKISGKCAGLSLSDIGWSGLVNRCVGGFSDGQLCPLGDSQCGDIEDGTCRGVCSGGDHDGEFCESAGDCAVGGTCDYSAGECDGGKFPGASCTTEGSSECLGEDSVCTPEDECPSLIHDELPSSCSAALSSVDDVATCLECTGSGSVDQLIDTYFGTLNDPSADKDDFKCQREVGKSTGKLFAAARKSLQKCEDSILKGKYAGPCPDTKANDKIGKAVSKVAAKIAQRCDTPDRIARALEAASVNAGASRYGDCTANVPLTPAGLADALECLTLNVATCSDALAIGDTACSFPTCGDGAIEPGETCDDGNTLVDNGVSSTADTCPADCSIASCAVTGTQTVTVSFSSTSDLTGMRILVFYDDAKGSIPGKLNQASVQARISSTNFVASPVNDLDYGVRVVLTDPSLVGVPSGEAFTINFDVCSAATLTAADFSCYVVDASDASLAPVAGATCSVTP